MSRVHVWTKEVLAPLGPVVLIQLESIFDEKSSLWWEQSDVHICPLSVTRQVLQSLPFGELYFLEYLLETI